MSALTSTFHLSRLRLDGPAERTVVEPWLTSLSHLVLNAYAEIPALATVEALPVRPASVIPSVPEGIGSRPLTGNRSGPARIAAAA